MAKWEFLNRNKGPLPPPPSRDYGQPPPTPWRPFYLRRLVISCFILTACVIIAALEVLNHISQSRNGLASSVERLHYVWTYTPTAILTIISALWARTEFQAKQNAPWRSLQHPEQVDKSLLLDYDNIPPVALWKSFKHRHFIVSAGIVCSLLLQLAILFSTSLLSLQRVHVQKLHVPIQLADVFDGSDPMSNETSLRAFDTLNQVQFENLTYPSGTNANLAFQSFSTPSISGVSVINAPIRAMEADLECEQATLVLDQWEVARSNDTWGGNAYEFINNRITTPSCTIFNLSYIEDFSTGGYSKYVARMMSITCDNSTDTDRRRILIFATHYHLGKMIQNNTAHPSTFWAHKYELVLDNSVQMFCKPRFSFVNMKATSNLSDIETTPDLKRVGIEKPNLANITAWDIADQVIQGSSAGNAANRPIAAHPAFSGNVWVPPEVLSGYTGPSDNPVDYTIQLGAWIAGKSGHVGQLLQDGMLEEIVSAFYRSMAAQIIRGGFMKQRTTQTNGSMILEDNRVLVMQSPLRVLEVCMMTSALIAAAMVLLRPNDGNLSQNPSNISTIANVLSNSQILRQSLRGTGASALGVLMQRISGNKFFLRILRQGTSIQADTDNSFFDSRSQCVNQISDGGCTHQPNLFWKPFPSIWSRIPIFCVIAGAIIALETLLHVSQKNNGLGNASNDGNMHYLWTTVPSSAMMLIGLMIGSLDSNIRILAPYANLQKAQGINFEILATNFLDALRITNLARSARTGNFAVLSATLAALVASFLTIVTSGLFLAVEVPEIINLNFTQDTLFQPFSVSALLADLPGFIDADYILNDNLSYPRWTYEDLVFPELSFPEYSDWSTNDDLYADVRIPAIRGSSDCTFATGKALNYTVKSLKGEFPGFSTYGSQGLADGSGGPWQSLFNIHFYPPKHDCPVPGANSTFLTDHADAYYDIDFPEDGYFGQTFPIFCFGTEEAAQSRLTMYVWGYFENLTMRHISSMTCAGKIESVDTVARFNLPGFDITDDHPPIPDESSVKLLPQFNGVWDIYNLDLLNNYDPSLQDQITKEDIRIDNVFSSLLNGRYKIPREFLRNSKYDAKVQEAIKREESIVRAQPLRKHTLLAANGTLDDKPISGNLTVPKSLRVQQDKASTRVLEVMLGLILIFSILGSVLMNTDHVLPKNPMSIAAVGSLLADSNFLHLCRFTEHNPNYKLLRGCRVHLGWMDDGSLSESSSELDKSKDRRFFTIYMKTEKTEKTEDAEGILGIEITRSNSLKRHRADIGEGAWI